jgi:uncharacterized protein (TIGR02099 family)
MIHHVTRATRHLIFWSLVIIAISLSSVRLAIVGIKGYKTDLENQITAIAGAPVKLGRIGAKMRGISPELLLKDIDIASTLSVGKTAIHLNEIRLGINLGEFLYNRDVLSSSWVTLVGARLSVIRKQDGQFTVEGLRAGNEQPLWLLQGRRYEVLQSQITLQDQQKGGMPLVLDSVNLAIMNDGNHHRINVLAELPKPVGDRLKVILDFDAGDKFSDIKGTLFLEGNNVKPHGLFSTYLPFDIDMKTGSTDIKAWSQWEQAKPVSIKVESQIRQAIFSRKDREPFPISHLDTQINWRLNGQRWLVDINRFLLDSPGSANNVSKKWPDAIIHLAGEKAPDTGIQKLTMIAKQVDLAEMSKLLHFFAPLTDEQSQLLGQTKATGLLKDFSLYAEPETKGFALAGWFDGISIEPVLSMPGMANISGQVKGSDTQGAIGLDSQDSRLNLPRLFSKPLVIDRIKGQLNWRQDKDQWVLSAPAIALDSPVFKSESRLRVELPKGEEKPFVDLQTSFKSDDISHIAAYLPTKIMKEKLKSWLESAFIGGKVTKGNILLYGKVSDIPFADGTGVLEGYIDVEKLELSIHPEWPHISSINGRVSYEHNNIIGLGNSGKMGPVDIDNATILIPRLGSHDERLFIKGEAQGDIGEALNVLQQTPLANRVSPVTKATTTKGTTKVSLDLTIPLWKGQELVTDGSAQLKNAELTVNKLGLKVNNINGDLKFNKHGIYGNKIHANAFGQAIQVNITQADQQTLINVDGSAKVSDIQNLFGWSPSQLADGEGDYQLQLQLPNSTVDLPTQVNVKSTLQGIALQLPGTLSKTKEQRKPSSVTVKLNDASILPIALDYNHELKAALNLNAADQKISAGHILIGHGEAILPKVAELKLEINREQLQLQDWLNLAAPQQPGKPNIDINNINEIKIHSASAMWDKAPLGAFDLSLKRNSKVWAGEIDSNLAKGKLQFPLETRDANPIIMEMDMLNLSAIKQLKTQGTSTEQDFNPLLNIQSKKTLLQSKNLGQLVLETVRTPKGINIKQLELTGDDETLLATGNWQDKGLTSSTHLTGKLELKKADQFLDKLNITKDLTDTKGAIDFDLRWNAPPLQLALPNLQGTMDVDLKSGRILSIEPGFGRVLGILAMAQWIKRLQLDFSDIYAEGLTFNSIKGHFDLLNGKATTKGLVIDAVPAKITIIGDTDLVNQTVDHVIKVVPKSLDALPIAGTIVGRVAAMVGKTLTGEDQEGFFFGTQYLVKGSWDDVKISSQHENDGLFQKTWNSITDFPWAGSDKQQ